MRLTHAGFAVIDHCSLPSPPSSLIPMRLRRSEAEKGAFRYAAVHSFQSLLPLSLPTSPSLSPPNGAISKLISAILPSPKEHPPFRPSRCPSVRPRPSVRVRPSHVRLSLFAAADAPGTACLLSFPPAPARLPTSSTPTRRPFAELSLADAVPSSLLPPPSSLRPKDDLLPRATGYSGASVPHQKMASLEEAMPFKLSGFLSRQYHVKYFSPENG